MATLTQTRLDTARQITLTKRREQAARRRLPRRCMVVSAALVVAGPMMALLMLVGWLPTTLATGFVALALMIVGGTLLLTLCGEL